MNRITTSLAAVAIVASVTATGSATASAGADARPAAGACTSYTPNYQYSIGPCDKGDAVRVIQSGVRSVDPDLAIDGYFGTRTQQAVRAFQAAHGLTVDGYVGRATWPQVLRFASYSGTDRNRNGVVDPYEATYAPVPASPPPAWQCARYVPLSSYPLSLCDKGPAVAMVQANLVAQGWATGVADGYFGPMTEAAVRYYQASNGLASDGLVGPATWATFLDGFMCGSDTNGNGTFEPSEVVIHPPVSGNGSEFMAHCYENS